MSPLLELMRAAILTLAIILWQTPGYGQTVSIDSLQQVIENTNNDSIRIRALMALSTAYNFKDFVRARQYLEEARSLAEERDWAWARGVTLANFGLLSALEGDFTTAIHYGNQALSALGRDSDSLYISRTLNNLGDYHLELGHYDEAYLNFTQAFRVARARGDSLILLITLHNVGKVFKELGQYERARDHIVASLRISHKQKDAQGDAFFLLESGDILFRQKRYDSALNTLQRALTQVRRTAAFEIEPRTLDLIADTYLELGNFEQSKKYYDSALSIQQHNNNDFGIAQSTLGIGSMLIRQNRFKEAEDAIAKCLALSQSLNAMTLERDCYTQMAQVKEALKQYDLALEYYKKYRSIEREIFSQEMLEKLSSEQIRFETEARDFQIAELNKLDEAQRLIIQREVFIRNILVILMAVIAFLLFTVYRSGRRRRRINQLLVEHQAEMERRQDELVQLNQVKDKFFSIVSHDLRSPLNALGAILGMVEKGQIKPEEFQRLAKELRTQFTHTKALLNNLLDWALLQMDKLTLQPTLLDLREMVDENFRLFKSLHVKEIELNNSLAHGTQAFADLNTINLVLRNLILNAIKFTDNGGIVKVTAEDRGGEWEVTVTDNGKGIERDALKVLFDKTALYSTRGTADEQGTGLGLILCKEFVEKNGGRIWVQSSPGVGSAFTFTVKKAV